MRQTMHQYNQSGDLLLSHTSRAVYDNGPEKAPEPQQAPKPPEAKVDAPANANVPQAPDGGLAAKWFGNLKNIANSFIALTGRAINAGGNAPGAPDYRNAMSDLSGKAATIVEKANTVGATVDTAKLQQEQPVIQKLADAAPTATPPIAPVATPTEDPSLKLKEVDNITEADVAATQLLKQTEALFDTTLKGKVTPEGWLNYLGDTNGISQDIAGYSGTFSKNDLETKNFIVSSPVSTVEAIKLLQQSLGVTADGIFGPVTYDALLKKNSDAALILLKEKAADTSLDLKKVIIPQ